MTLDPRAPHSFVGTAKEQHEKLELMHNNMEEQYSELGRFYVFDPRKMSVEEFFGDLKTFKTMFEVSVCPHIIPQRRCVLDSDFIFFSFFLITDLCILPVSY